MGVVPFNYSEYITQGHIDQLESIRHKALNTYAFYGSVRLIKSECKDCREIHLVLAEYDDGDSSFLFPYTCDKCNSKLIMYSIGRSAEDLEKVRAKYGEPPTEIIDLRDIGRRMKNNER